MKLINHQKNNYSTDKEGTVYRGSIYVNKHEYQKIIAFVIDNNLDHATHEIESHDTTKDYISLGVTATRQICDRFDLKRYKDINYLIIIK